MRDFVKYIAFISLFKYLDTYLRSSWWAICTILKSSLANSIKTRFVSCLLSYESKYHLVSSLLILQWYSISSAWIAFSSTSRLQVSPSTNFLICFFANGLMTSRNLISDFVERYDASYSDMILFISSLLNVSLSILSIITSNISEN